MLESTGTLAHSFLEEYAAPVLTERFNAPAARFSLLDDMIVERGERCDWDLLHELHYKISKLAPGSRYWKCTLYGETIGVLVTSCPKGLLRERHAAFPKIKPHGGDSTLTNVQRFKYINDNFRVVSRFVFDTLYRGIGCGYRMVNLVSRMERMTYMEMQSSMSKFNMFGQKAGFRFVKPMTATAFEAGLKFFRSRFEASPQDYQAVVAEILAKTQAEQDVIADDCRKFYYKCSALEQTGSNQGGDGHRRVAAMDIPALIKGLQQVTLASPMYGVFFNPDKGDPLPNRLPLLAFDRQKPTEKLQWDA